MSVSLLNVNCVRKSEAVRSVTACWQDQAAINGCQPTDWSPSTCWLMTVNHFMTSVRLLNECQSSDFCLPACFPISASLSTFLQPADCLSAWRPVTASLKNSCQLAWGKSCDILGGYHSSDEKLSACWLTPVNLLTNICQLADRYLLVDISPLTFSC
jgi:hypothetical protein